VLNRIRAMRGGKLNDPTFGKRMTGQGIFAEQMERVFDVASRKYGLDKPMPPLSTDAFRRVTAQLSLELS
jgi:hypothetical protein